MREIRHLIGVNDHHVYAIETATAARLQLFSVHCHQEDPAALHRRLDIRG
jgi:hypothetical protein